MMGGTTFAAAILVCVIGVAHSWLGERVLVSRLLRLEHLPRLGKSDGFTRRIIRFAWHLTTVAWWGLGSILLLLSGVSFGCDVHRAVIHVIAATFFISGIMALLWTRGRHLSWIVFFAIAILCWVTLGPA